MNISKRTMAYFVLCALLFGGVECKGDPTTAISLVLVNGLILVLDNPRATTTTKL